MNRSAKYKQQAKYIYILSVLMAAVMFIDDIPDVVRGVCLFSGFSGLVIALLLYRAGKNLTVQQPIKIKR